MCLVVNQGKALLKRFFRKMIHCYCCVVRRASHYEIFTFAHMHCYPPHYNLLQIFRKVCQCCFFMDVANPNTFLCLSYPQCCKIQKTVKLQDVALFKLIASFVNFLSEWLKGPED